MLLLEAHRSVPAVSAPADQWSALQHARPRGGSSEHEAVLAAGRSRRLLPQAVHDALADFATDGRPVGALLVRGVPLGAVPVTPASPTAPSGTDGTTEHTLLTVARALGHPVGYSAEHGGRIMQNLLPTPDGATRQTSTSSAVELEFHTETAFHPFRPHYLLLLCLRADPSAATLLCSIEELLPRLSADQRSVLAQPRFRTAVDESFAGVHPGPLGPPIPVLSGDPAHPTLVFDADLMVGIDPESAEVLDALRSLALAHRIGVVLEPGDLLVVDNHACIHGRTAFRARFDGTDRWLQRSFVVSDLAASAADRDGMVITTTFG